MQRFQILGLLSMFFIINACSNDEIPEDTTPCDNTGYTFLNEVKPIIDATCAYEGCHNGSPAAPGNYLSYDGMVSSFNGLFQERTLIKRNMPPSYATGQTSLTQEQIDILECWKEDGFPE